MRKLFIISTSFVAALSVSACNPFKKDDKNDNSLAAALFLTTPVTIRMQLMAGSSTFGCSSAATTFGTTSTNSTLQDMRFFVSGVNLIKADGSRVPVTLSTDTWQDGSGGVALLDFEDKTGSCAGAGTTDTNTSLRGSIPVFAGSSFTGVEFTLGVPFSLNHLDSTIRPSPYNISGMFWNWAGGYKFMKAEITQGNASSFHLGSVNNNVAGTACDGVTTSTGTTPPAQACQFPNRGLVTLTKTGGYNPSSDIVAVDVKNLFSGIDVSGAGITCMSGRAGMMGGAGNCQNTFTRAGVDWTSGASSAATQTTFRIL